MGSLRRPFFLDPFGYERRRLAKLVGLDLAEEYRKVRERTSGLSRSMRELVVEEYERLMAEEVIP